MSIVLSDVNRFNISKVLNPYWGLAHECEEKQLYSSAKKTWNLIGCKIITVLDFLNWCSDLECKEERLRADELRKDVRLLASIANYHSIRISVFIAESE